jgi:hypothetical protein
MYVGKKKLSAESIHGFAEGWSPHGITLTFIVESLTVNGSANGD